MLASKEWTPRCQLKKAKRIKMRAKSKFLQFLTKRVHRSTYLFLGYQNADLDEQDQEELVDRVGNINGIYDIEVDSRE